MIRSVKLDAFGQDLVRSGENGQRLFSTVEFGQNLLTPEGLDGTCSDSGSLEKSLFNSGDYGLSIWFGHILPIIREFG